MGDQRTRMARRCQNAVVADLSAPLALPGDRPALVQRMQEHSTTIFAEMSELAAATGAVNLGQGFPDTDGPEVVRRAAVEAIERGDNQYPPGLGVPVLRQAIADHQARRYGLRYDPDTEILVTAGATEAIATTLLALCEAGDEVVAFEPFYDSYTTYGVNAGLSWGAYDASLSVRNLTNVQALRSAQVAGIMGYRGIYGTPRTVG